MSQSAAPPSGESSSKLWDAIRNNNESAVRDALRVDPTAANNRKLVTNAADGPLGMVTPLHIAAHFGNVEGKTY